MTSIDNAFFARWPGLANAVLARLTGDGQLFDSASHHLRPGVSGKAEARAILLVAATIARRAGFELVLSADERALMARRFYWQHVFDLNEPSEE